MTKLEEISDVIKQYINDVANSEKNVATAEKTIVTIQRIVHSNSSKYDENQVYEVRIVTEDSNYSDGYYASLENAVSHIIEKAVFVDNRFYYYYEGSPNHLPAYCVALHEGRYENNSLEEIRRMLTESIKGNCIGVNCEKGVYYICTHPLVDK